MGLDVLGLDLYNVGDPEVCESDRVSFWVCDLLVDLFCGEEVEFFELLDGLVLLHDIRYQVYKSINTESSS